jgi:tRNA-guanine family transglycosylase
MNSELIPIEEQIMSELKYFISHYPYDPKYWEILGDKVDGVLISHRNLHTGLGNPTSLLREMKKLKSIRQPLSIDPAIPIIVDSGAYQFMHPSCKKLPITCREIYDTYLSMGAEKGVHLDWPVLESLSKYWKKKRLIVTEENAKKFIELNDEHALTIVGAVQGYGQNGKYMGYGEMAEKFIKWGYTEIGIGGLALLARGRKMEVLLRIMDVIKVLQEYEDINLHVFGIGSIDLLAEIVEQYPHLSFDNATPTFSAIKREILFFDGTYKRYKIKKESEMIRAGRILRKCECYACKKYGLEIMKMGSRELNVARMIHNYYHYYAYVRSVLAD